LTTIFRVEQLKKPEEAFGKFLEPEDGSDLFHKTPSSVRTAWRYNPVTLLPFAAFNVKGY
jgi:hypothetical protein